MTGFIARDPESGSSYVMHTGKLGGGRKGIGKRAFLKWSGLPRVDVLSPNGKTQKGIVVTSLDGDVAGRVWRFVRIAAAFKAAVKEGSVPAETLQEEKDDPHIDRYRGEFSGWKAGSTRGVPLAAVLVLHVAWSGLRSSLRARHPPGPKRPPMRGASTVPWHLDRLPPGGMQF